MLRCGGCGGGRADDLHSAFSCRNLIFLRFNLALQRRFAISAPARASGGPARQRRKAFDGRFTGASGFPLGIKTYYILCSCAGSTLIIVAWQKLRKRFFMFRKGLVKPLFNQSSTGKINVSPPRIHRFSTVLSTEAVDNSMRAS
jgi:hypothetical protein